jgi:hypothetical protein
MTCAQHLLVVYRAYVIRTGTRLEVLDRAMSWPVEIAPLSEDERRNEPPTYAALFSPECEAFLEQFYQKAMHMMNGRPFDDCGQPLQALAFFQEVVATALWRHRCTVGNVLASFAREFDRLDVHSERERLHARAQTT